MLVKFTISNNILKGSHQPKWYFNRTAQITNLLQQSKVTQLLLDQSKR